MSSNGLSIPPFQSFHFSPPEAALFLTFKVKVLNLIILLFRTTAGPMTNPVLGSQNILKIATSTKCF
jgi:hypothetical protein